MKLLPERVIHIHECIKKLLLDFNEDSIVCLCKVLIHVYEPIDQETNKRLSGSPQTGLSNLSEYLDMLNKLRMQKEFSSGVNSQINEVKIKGVPI
jgi:hypothetical protein